MGVCEVELLYDFRDVLVLGDGDQEVHKSL